MKPLGEIVKTDGMYRIERTERGTYILRRERKSDYSWEFVGDILPEGKDTYVALINKVYDPMSGSDVEAVYKGDNLDAALGALWLHRYEAA